MEVRVKYHARVERDGRFWLIHVPEIDRWTQGRHLREIEPMARDLIALMTDVPPDAFDLELDILIPDEVRAHLDRAERLRAESTSAQAAAASEVREAARMLHEAGLPLRDVGRLLGISYQRAHQLIA